MMLKRIVSAREDSRGTITNIAPDVSVIVTRAGSVRSNHYHRDGWHYLYVLSGRMVYRELVNGVVESVILTAGDRVLTGPRAPHRTEFPEDTVLVSVGPTSNSEGHEEDLVRVEWP